MSDATRTLPSHTVDAPIECPILDERANATFITCVAASKELSREIGEFLGRKNRGEQGAWLKQSIVASRAVFQPWSMEILYVLALLRRARFSELHDALGLSSRTLSDKLKSLKAAGLIERDVIDDQPVRIEYALTKHGRATTALATPLFTHLNLEAGESLRAAQADALSE